MKAESTWLQKLNFREKDRVESFKEWPFDSKSPCNVQKMAEAGFYWCGNKREKDTATCFVCGKTLDGWEKDDDPWDEHMKHAPQCIFVKTRKTEDDLTVEEQYDLLETIVKAHLERDSTAEKKAFNSLLEAARTELSSI